MSKTDYYARLHDLLIHPEEAAITTVENRRWVTDRYVLLDALHCGIGVAIGEVDDGWYAVRRSGPPRKTGVWGLDDDGDAGKFAESIAKLMRSWLEQWNEWAELTPTSWAIASEGTNGVEHARVLLDPDRRPTCLNSTWLGRWTRYVGQARLEQPKGEPRRVIRVFAPSSHTTGSYETVTDWSHAAWIMPVGRPELPDVLTLPTVG